MGNSRRYRKLVGEEQVKTTMRLRKKVDDAIEILAKQENKTKGEVTERLVRKGYQTEKDFEMIMDQLGMDLPELVADCQIEKAKKGKPEKPRLTEEERDKLWKIARGEK